MSSKGLALWVAMVVALVLVMGVELTQADCNPADLAICAPALSGSGDPSPECCAEIKEQRPCYCQYLKDPSLRDIINSPEAKNVVCACGVDFPNC